MQTLREQNRAFALDILSRIEAEFRQELGLPFDLAQNATGIPEGVAARWARQTGPFGGFRAYPTNPNDEGARALFTKHEFAIADLMDNFIELKTGL